MLVKNALMKPVEKSLGFGDEGFSYNFLVINYSF